VRHNKSVHLGISNRATAKLNAENKNATQRRGVFDPDIREGSCLASRSVPSFQFRYFTQERRSNVIPLVLALSATSKYSVGNPTKGGSDLYRYPRRSSSCY
jgi:hypothetical protein